MLQRQGKNQKVESWANLHKSEYSVTHREQIFYQYNKLSRKQSAQTESPREAGYFVLSRLTLSFLASLLDLPLPHGNNHLAGKYSIERTIGKWTVLSGLFLERAPPQWVLGRGGGVRWGLETDIQGRVRGRSHGCIGGTSVHAAGRLKANIKNDASSKWVIFVEFCTTVQPTRCLLFTLPVSLGIIRE